MDNISTVFFVIWRNGAILLFIKVRPVLCDNSCSMEEFMRFSLLDLTKFFAVFFWQIQSLNYTCILFPQRNANQPQKFRDFYRKPETYIVYFFLCFGRKKFKKNLTGQTFKLFSLFCSQILSQFNEFNFHGSTKVSR